MAEEKGTFFCKLGSLARHLDREVENLKRAANYGTGENDNHSQASRTLLDATAETKTLRDQMLDQLVCLQNSGSRFEKVFSQGTVVLRHQMERLSRLEDFLSQYGFVRPAVKEESKPETQQDQAETDTAGEGAVDVETAESETANNHLDSQSPPAKAKPALVSRTPRLEDFGLSSHGLAVLKKQTATIDRTGTLEMPSMFDSSGVLVTPHLFDNTDWTKGSPGPGLRLRQVNISTLSQPCFEKELGQSPVPPLLTTSGVRQVNQSYKENLPLPVFPPPVVPSQCPHTPQPPELQTPWVRQIQKLAELPAPAVPKPPSKGSTSSSISTPSPPVLKTPGIKQINKAWQFPVEPTPPPKRAPGATRSPIPPILATPGVRQISQVPLSPEEEEETVECSFALRPPRTPQPPILNTPGLKQIRRTLEEAKSREVEEEMVECTFPIRPSLTPRPPKLLTPGYRQIGQYGDSRAAFMSQVVKKREVTPIMQNMRSDKLWADTPEPPEITFSLADMKNLRETLK